MQYTILLDKNENTKEIETKEQARFIKNVLETLEIPIDFNSENPLTVEDKIKFRKSLNTYNLSIVDDMDGGVKIFVDSEIIAEWYKCKYKLKEDRSQVDPRKRIFLEMSVNFWTAFETAQK